MGLAAMATTARGMAATVRVLGRGELGRFTGGDRSEVARFESELAGFLGTSHALAVNSGTSALVAALVGAGVGPGDEVLVPAYTWVSTAAAALAVGAVPVLVEVDLQGARSVKRVLPEAVTVFVAPPSMEELARRLTDRGTDTPEQRERRLRTAIEEMDAQGEFDEVVVNDDLQAVIGRLVALAVDRGAV